MWHDPRIVLARKELRSLADEKTIVLALLIQLFVAAFSSFLVVGLVSMYQPGGVGGVSVDAAVAGDAADELLATLDDQPSVDAREYESPDAAAAAFQRGTVDATFLASHSDENRIEVAVTVPDENVRTTVTVVQVRDALRAFERDQRASRVEYLGTAPLSLPPEPASSPYYGFSYTVLVPLLLLLPAFIGGSITVDSLTEEIDRGTMALLRVSPLSPAGIVDGKLLASVLLAPAQAALWMALLAVNGTPVANLPALLLLTTAFALAVSALGAAVALLSPERRAAQFLYSTGVLGLFGAAALLPGSPPNTIARLAVNSASVTTYGVVAGYVALGIGAYLAVRALVTRRGDAALE
ncbi:ABC transporter permease [Halolamina sp. C58]|uniref:ABC transporter permease n=1 Tax=Halolamina sp. C58 TaxID=3421640 RepID=UPI003EBB04BF